MGMMLLTDALEEATKALMLARPPEDLGERAVFGQHLEKMTAGIEATKDATGPLLEKVRAEEDA